MIDFRYHIVSLVSVFLALAVGIVLGAGPLEQTIGTALNDQVELLRAEKDQMRAELQVAQEEAAESTALFDAAVPALVADILGQRRVALVLVDDVAPETVESVTALIVQAGGTVTTTAQVTDAWTDPVRAAFRRSLATTVAGYLDPAPTSTEAPGRLAEALVHGLVTSLGTDPDVLDPDAAMVLELLVSSELVEGAIPAVPADAVVILADPGPLEPASPSPTPPTDPTGTGLEETPTPDSAVPEEVLEHRARVASATGAIAAAAQARSAGTVVAGDAADPTAAVAHLRAGELAGAISTVDSIDTLAGQAAVPLALAQRLRGTVGHYGTGEGATSVLPERHSLDVIVRVPRAPLPPEPECVPGEDGTTECEVPEGEGGETGADDATAGATDGQDEG